MAGESQRSGVGVEPADPEPRSRPSRVGSADRSAAPVADLERRPRPHATTGSARRGRAYTGRSAGRAARRRLDPRSSTPRTSTAASASAPPASRRARRSRLDLRAAPPRRRVPLDARQRRAARRRRRRRRSATSAAASTSTSARSSRSRSPSAPRQLRLAERRQGQFLAMLSHELRNPLAPIANAASVLRTLEQQQSDPGPPARDPRAPGRPPRPPDRGADRRHPRRPGPDLAGARAGRRSTASSRRRSRRATTSSTTGRPSPRGRRARRAPVRPRRPRPAGAGALAPDHQRGQVHASSRARSRSACGAPRRTVQISVKDRAQGIDPKFLPHAFELFAQQDQTLARTLGGLGVGLTLARRIAQLHGGDVEGFSEGPGRGSEFVLWLPLVEPEAAADAVDRRRAAPERELPRPDRRGQRRHAREPAPADGALGHRGQHRAQCRGSARDRRRSSGRRSSCATSACPAWMAFASSSALREHAGRHARRLRRGDRLCQRRRPAARAGRRLRLVLRQAAQPRQPRQPAALVPPRPPERPTRRRGCALSAPRRARPARC